MLTIRGRWKATKAGPAGLRAASAGVRGTRDSDGPVSELLFLGYPFAFPGLGPLHGLEHQPLSLSLRKPSPTLSACFSFTPFTDFLMTKMTRLS